MTSSPNGDDIIDYEGKREGYAALNDFYAPGPMAYIRLIGAWRENPNLPGLALTLERR